MFVVKADTAEEMRELVVKELRSWMRDAHIRSDHARLVSEKRFEVACEKAFENAAQFFEELHIEPKPGA